MATFKKPKRNLRKRGEIGFSDENDSEEKSNLNSDGFSFVKKPDKKIKKELTKTSVLSFGEELDEGDDGEIFQVKKSSQSKKIRKLLDKEKKKKKDVKSDDAADKDNTKEILVDDEITIKIKNPINVPRVLNGREALATLSESSDEDEDASNPGTMRHKFSHSDHMKQLLKSGCIPDAAMIHAARKRRQEARELGVEYIPINEKNGQEKESKTDLINSNSRLVREDDEGSDDEDKIIKMSLNSASADKERRREAFAAAQDDVYEEGHDDDIDKDDEWEKQQIRKGVTGAQLVAVQQENLYYQQFMMQQTPVPASLNNMAAVSAAQPDTCAPTTLSLIPPLPPTDVNTAIDPPSVVKKMKDRLADMKEVHRRHFLDCDSMRREMEALQTESERLDVEGPVLADKFRFYQDLRGYVTDLVECLDEKVVILLALEKRLMTVYKKRCSDLMARRRQDVKDQAEELASSASKSLMRDEERVRRAAEREGRRIRRLRLREQKGVAKHMDGMSSDDEVTEMEAAAFRTQKETVEQDAKHVFEDALDDFATVGGILKRFESWKKSDPDAYTEAYVNLCLPKVLGPLIRLNILMWNPLAQAGSDLERTPWYVSLINYGISKSETEESLRADPDLQLIPRVFEKVIIHKLNQLVDANYDPISTSQSLSLVQILSNLIHYYPTLNPESKNMNTLLNTIVMKLRNAIENDVFIPIYPKQMMEGRMNYFFQRQFAMGVKLLSNIVRWQGIVSDEIVFELALDSLLNRYLLLAIRISEPFQAAAKCYMVSSVLPKVWLQPDNTPEQLKSLINQAKVISEQLDQTRPLARDAVEKLSCLLRLVT